MRAGLYPNSLPVCDNNKMSFSDGRSKAKTWKDIWGAGQGVGQIDSLLSVQEIVNQLRLEYQEALQSLSLRA